MIIFVPKSNRGYCIGKVCTLDSELVLRIQSARRQVRQNPIQFHVAPDSFSSEQKGIILSNAPVQVPKWRRFPRYYVGFDRIELVDPIHVPF